MKNFIIIAFILIPQLLFAQSDGIGSDGKNGEGINFSGGSWKEGVDTPPDNPGPSYDPDAVAFWTEFSTEPHDTMKQKISTLYTMFKDSLVYDSIAYMWGSFGTTQESSIELKNPGSKTLTLNNSPGFNPYEGWLGNGTNAFINTGVNLNTEGGVYSQNSSAVMIYCRTDAISNGNIFGAQTTPSAVKCFLKYTDNKVYADINDKGDSAFSMAVSSSAGTTTLRRNNNLNFDVLKNSVLFGSKNTVSVAPPNLQVYWLCRNNSGSPALYTSGQQVSWLVFGSGWSNTAERKIKNIIEWFMDSNGKGVIP